MSEAEPTSFGKRVLRTALLDADTFEEIEAEPSAIWQALGIVLSICAISALGAWLKATFGDPLPGSRLPLSLQLAVIGSEPVVTWLASSAFTYMVGATFLRGPETETDYAEVLRTTGFAFAPGVFAGFGWVQPEVLGLSALLIARVWVLVASVIAVRQALDFSTARAIGTFGVSYTLMFLVLWGLTAAPLPF